ncbi:lipoprotein [Vibrio sinaloensis]|uniref:lipoprotein n=1 Tax=Photobacterium sp. (strain ATCC 43367) TaxID=379097 RepID=UPI000A424A82|nr:lipoprotein [Vibrio sinaloensis]
MKKPCFALCFVALLAGCQITSVEGEYRDVEVKLKNKESSTSGDRFCPPGQAKKGNC